MEQKPNSDRNARVVVVMPAYNAAQTLHRTYQAIPKDSLNKRHLGR